MGTDALKLQLARFKSLIEQSNARKLPGNKGCKLGCATGPECEYLCSPISHTEDVDPVDFPQDVKIFMLRPELKQRLIRLQKATPTETQKLSQDELAEILSIPSSLSLVSEDNWKYAFAQLNKDNQDLVAEQLTVFRIKYVPPRLHGTLKRRLQK
jgi:hypothetical protein